MKNPFLQVYLDMQAHQLEHERTLRRGQPNPHGCFSCLREGKSEGTHVRNIYSWAIPTEEAIHFIASHTPNGIVEVGAGFGYWAWLLRQINVQVYPYDIAPDGNLWCDGSPWTSVLQGGTEVVKSHREQALFMCWPPYNDYMAFDTLWEYEGDTLIYIGEDRSGCTADDLFFVLLEEEWEEIAYHGIPQWMGIHDYVTVYRRR